MEKMKMPVHKKFWAFVTVVLLVGVLFSAGCAKAKTTTQEKPKEVPLEELIRSLPQFQGNETVSQKPHLNDLSINDSGVIINYYPEINSTIDKAFISKTLTDVLKPLNKRQDIVKIYINLWQASKDSSQKDKVFGQIQISQLKLNNIDFKNFDYMTLQDKVDIWYVDPSIKN